VLLPIGAEAGELLIGQDVTDPRLLVPGAARAGLDRPGDLPP
jgi:hypothetical protein